MEAPVVISRLQWGARPSHGALRGLGAVEQVVIHHAAGFGAATRQEGARRVLALQQLHQDGAGGCPDIGYHFLVDAGGHVYQGLPFLRGETLAELPRFALGTHLPQVGSHKLGICLLGCFHADPDCCDSPTPLALAALESLLAFVCRGYGVRPCDILTHRDFAPGTCCPGERLYVAIGRLRERLSRRLGEETYA